MRSTEYRKYQQRQGSCQKMSDLSEADFGTALYRSRDSIQNIRIKYFNIQFHM